MSADFQISPINLMSKLQEVPHKPGIYLMLDRLGRVIYVGKAKDLRKRLSSYFTPSRKIRADIKTRALIDSIWDFDLHTVKNETEALLLEGKLIKEYRPKYNVVFRDDKRFMMLKVNLSDPLPRFQLVRVRKEDGSRYFGPFPHSGALRFTFHWINKQFGLRTCRSSCPGESDYKHCNDDVIRNCAAPCIGKVSSEKYRDNVEEACRFLDGGWRDSISEIESQMDEASSNQEYELAADFRDMIDSLKKILQPTRRFTRGRGIPGSNIDPATDIQELRSLLGMEVAPITMECFDISNISSNHIVASMVRFEKGVPDNSNYRRYRIKTVKSQDDFSSMAEVVRRRYSRILLEAKKCMDKESKELTQERPSEVVKRLSRTGSSIKLPDLVIVDGGQGQLSSALKELKKLGLEDLPIIGLAKKNEEIYRPGAIAPLRIPHETGALKLLQRIRDEAHRFANSYHQLLMKRRIEESVLDDCPGLSEARKKKLLKRFGSVARIKKVKPKEIAEIKGISLKMAEQIIEYLC